jgi:hypothetical protein
MNTLTRTNAAVELGKRKKVDIQLLEALFASAEYKSSTEAQKADVIQLAVQKVADLKPSPAKNTMNLLIADEGRKIRTQAQCTEHSKPRESEGLDALAKQLIADAVSAAMRQPSPNLKNGEFRTLLLHRRQLLTMAMKTADEPTAFCNVVCAIGEAEGGFEALRFVRDTARQMLWQASALIGRARRTASEVEETASDYRGDGSEDHEPNDYVAAPTEDEVRDSFVEAHGWLSNIADLLPVDEDDRIRLGLEDGLEFCQIKEEDEALGTVWRRVHDLDEALDWQIAKNIESMKKRDGKKIAARKDSFKALAALAAA